jgi:hypothetical protein
MDLSVSWLTLAGHDGCTVIGKHRGHQAAECRIQPSLSRLIIVRPCTTAKSHPWPKQTANGFDADFYHSIRKAWRRRQLTCLGNIGQANILRDYTSQAAYCFSATTNVNAASRVFFYHASHN